MFVRKIQVLRVDAEGAETPCPIRWIDNFAMRNFTNDAAFDDTLPVGMGCSMPATVFRWSGCGSSNWIRGMAEGKYELDGI